MFNKLAENLSFIFLLASALFLPWQTKLIWLPAPSNYWEVSFFAASIFVFFFIIFFILSGHLRRADLKDILEKESSLWLAVLVLLFAAFVSAGFSPLPTLSLFRFFLLFLAFLFFYCLSLSPRLGAVILSAWFCFLWPCRL